MSTRYWMRDVLGILPGLLGSLLMVVGIGIYFSYLYIARSEVKRFLIIDSAEHSQYDNWVRGEYGANIAETTIFAANVTNPLEVLGGALPAIDFVGPYVYDTQLKRDHVFFTNEGCAVVFNTTSTYHLVNATSAAREHNATIVVFNQAIVDSIEFAGVDRLPFLFASATLRKVASTDLFRWANGTSVCDSDLYGACNPAHYFESGPYTNPFLGVGDAIVATVLQDLSDVRRMVRFLQEVELAKAMADVPPNPKLVWRAWEAAGMPTLTLSQLQSIEDYLRFTGRVVMDAMQSAYCLPASIIFIRVDPQKVAFVSDVFSEFLFGGGVFADQSRCLLCNGTSTRSTLRTGKDNEKYIGMDYYVEMNGVGSSTVGNIVTPNGVDQVILTLEGRSQSLQPFQYSVPRSVQIRAPMIQRKVRYNYTSTKEYKNLKVRRYELDLKPMLPSDTAGSFGLHPVFSTSLAVSRVGFHGAGWYESLSREMLMRGAVSDLIGEPLGFFHAEEVSGFGVDNSFTAQVSLQLNFSKVNGSYFNVPTPSILSSSIDGRVHPPEDGKVLFVPTLIVVQRSYANDQAASFLNHQTNELLDSFNLLLISTVSIGAVLLACSMVWVVWDTQGTAVMREDDYHAQRKSR